MTWEDAPTTSAPPASHDGWEDAPKKGIDTPYQNRGSDKVLSLADRLKKFATEGQAHIFGHEVPQLAAGALGTPAPAAATPEDVADRKAGSQLALGLGARMPTGGSSLLSPPALRGGSWLGGPPSVTGKMTGIDPIAALKALAQNPGVREVLKRLLQASGVGAGIAGASEGYNTLKKFLP